jgi:putative DNA primase/helicase
LNLINGTYDLNTNTLMQHRAGDLLTKRAEVVYDPAATCPRWMAFLDRVQHGNQEMIAFLQRAAGLSLSGIVPEQVFFFLHGKGANGKTTLIEVLHAIYCGYAVAAPEEMLLTRQKNRGTASPELTRLRSARFVSAIELPEGGRLDESLIKQLTGGDTISARNLYEQFFEFKPTHKLWIAGNHRPIITGTDDAIWRRPLLIPFPVKIPESEQRRNMQEYLLEESSGILNWLLAGWRQYRDMGLGVPECVRAATAEYRSEQDLLGDFLDECCDKGEGLTVTHADLMFDYKLWAERQGIEPLGGRRISESLAERGFVRMRRHAGTRGWKGLALQVSDPRSSG